jgi:streptomycin 6-kinase
MALDESATSPSVDELAALLRGLHDNGDPDPAYQHVAERVAYLFDSGTKPYERRPELVDVVPPPLYERSRSLALELAADASPVVLLHGDLTAVNVLDGGPERGLVAVDPAPCLGDAAFDAVDLVFWRAQDAAEVVTRAERLAPAIGADPGRLVDWCVAFAGMVALEIAETDGEIRPFLDLASR